jgi:deoxyribonuclease V
MGPRDPLPPFAATVAEARRVQEHLRAQVRHVPLPLDRIRLAGAADVTYVESKERVAAAVVLYDMGSGRILEEHTAERRTGFPYVPGYLTFREGPAVAAAWKKLSRRPDVMVYDGHGIAHPRRFGIASHMGVLLSVPSVGCAKSRLVGEHDPPGIAKGSVALLRDGEEILGAAVRTRAGVRPVFVSVGHLADLDTAIALVLSLCTRYRLPEPSRRAHQLTRELRARLRP